MLKNTEGCDRAELPAASPGHSTRVQPVSVEGLGKTRAMSSWDSDFIEIEGLAIQTIIGTLDEERHAKQKLIVNLRLYTDTRRAAARDHIDDAVDYQRLTEDIIRYVEESRFFLIEAVAEGIAERLLEVFGINRAIIRIEKPAALRHARTVSVTIDREQTR